MSTAPATIENKHEKKARKALEKLGLKEVPSVRVFSMKKRQGNLIIEVINPQVFKAQGQSGTETWVAYGKLQTSDLSARARGAYRSALAAAAQAPAYDDDSAAASGEAATEEEADDDDAPPPALVSSSVNEKNITLVMDQAKVSREEAIKALLATGDKPVEAVMQLMMP